MDDAVDASDFEPFTGEASPTVAMIVPAPDDAIYAVDEDAAISGLPGAYTIAGTRQAAQLTTLIDCEEYSTVEFGLASEVSPLTVPREAFSYSQAQSVPGSARYRTATRTDTSLYRAGSNGLPQSWAGFVFGWRARASAPAAVRASDAFRRWTETVCVEFKYSMKTYAKTMLADLLTAPRPITGDVMPPSVAALVPGQMSIPVHMREGLSFGVMVSPEDGATCEALRRALLDACGVDDTHKLLLAKLDAMGIGSERAIATVIEALTPRPVLIRIFLRGWWQRAVV